MAKSKNVNEMMDNILTKYKAKKMVKVKPETIGESKVMPSRKKEIYYPSVHIDNQEAGVVENKKIGDTVLLEGKIKGISKRDAEAGSKVSVNIDILKISN